jgi:hypothetical protein
MTDTDKFIMVHFNVYTNLDPNTNKVTASFLPYIHDHSMEEDLVPFAHLVDINLSAPRQKLWRELCKYAILPGLALTFQVSTSRRSRFICTVA